MRAAGIRGSGSVPMPGGTRTPLPRRRPRSGRTRLRSCRWQAGTGKDDGPRPWEGWAGRTRWTSRFPHAGRSTRRTAWARAGRRLRARGGLDGTRCSFQRVTRPRTSMSGMRTEAGGGASGWTHLRLGWTRVRPRRGVSMGESMSSPVNEAAGSVSLTAEM